MSYALNPLKTVQVLDPLVNINEEREYAILKGGQEVSWKNIISTSSNNNSSQFSCPPPNPGVIVDRKVYIKMPITIVFSGNPAVGQAAIQNQFDAFRAFPLSSILNVLTVTINNTAVSINMSDIIQPLLRYHNLEHTQEYEYSMTPTYMDQFTEYSDTAHLINASNRNPLNNYFDGPFGSVMNRGGFPMTVTIDDLAGTTTVTAELCEPLFLSPFFFGQGNHSGFIGVQTMDYTFNWVSDLSRVWSHGTNSSVPDFAIQSVTLSTSPSLLFKYITPQELMRIPRKVEYPYYTVDRYPSTIAGGAISANGGTRQFNSNNVQLNSIPRRIYLLARKQNPSYTDTDTYLSIENISVNWNNRAGLLSGASKQDLYNISKKNGCCLSWTQWSGGQTQFISGATNSSFGTVGSVLCLEFATDIGLQDLEAPGLNATYQLQLTGTVKNNSANAITAEFVIIVVSEGTFTIQDNRSISQIGVISRQDILDAKSSPMVDYHDVAHALGAGNFFGDVKRFFKNAGESIYKGLKKVGPYVEKALPYIAKYGPELLGLGEEGSGAMVGGRAKKGKKKTHRGGVLIGGCENCDEGCEDCMGGIPVGGKVLTRAQLRRRLNNY